MPILKRVTTPPRKRAWTIKEWGAEVCLSKATINRMIATNAIKSVTIGRARRITTPPDDFLAALHNDQSAA
jgi:hypothetical protein